MELSAPLRPRHEPFKARLETHAAECRAGCRFIAAFVQPGFSLRWGDIVALPVFIHKQACNESNCHFCRSRSCVRCRGVRPARPAGNATATRADLLRQTPGLC